MTLGVISDPFRSWALLPGVWPSEDLPALVDRWRLLLPSGNPHVWEEVEAWVAFASAGGSYRTPGEAVQFSVRMLTLLGKLRFPLVAGEVRQLLRNRMVGDKEPLTDGSLFRLVDEVYKVCEEKTRGTGARKPQHNNHVPSNSNTNSNHNNNHNNNNTQTAVLSTPHGSNNNNNNNSKYSFRRKP